MFLLLCEYATVSPGGDLSVVRGGLDRFATDGFPTHITGSLLLGFSRGELAVGEHAIAVRCTRENGDAVADLGAGQLKIKNSNAPSVFCLPFDFVAPEPGQFVIAVEVEGVEQGELPLAVVHRDSDRPAKEGEAQSK